MKSQAKRVILAFYPGDDGLAEQAFRSVAAANVGRARLIRQDSSTKRDVLRRYSHLRLSGEALVTVHAAPSKVQKAVLKLRSSGEPAIFVVRPEFSGSDAYDIKVQHGGTIGELARNCAGDRGQSARPTQRILARLSESEHTLDAVRRDLAETTRLDHTLTASADWLLDNAYLIRTNVAEIRRNLPKDYPKILSGFGSGGYPCVYALAHKLSEQTDYSINQSKITEALSEYQKVAPLTIAELWSFPLMLRLALIEGLASLATRVNQAQQSREAAYLWANRLAASARRGPEPFSAMILHMEGERVATEHQFVTSLAEQLQDEEGALAPLQRWIEVRLDTSLTEVVRSEHNREAAERISIANAFGSLRALSQIDFTEIFESVSLVDQELRADPAGIYPHSDFSTRDQCRRSVERVSRHSGIGEVDVARRAVALAEHAHQPHAQNAAHYLIDEGLAQLEAETRARMPVRVRLIRLLRRRSTPFYFSSILGLTACFLSLTLALAWDMDVRHHGLLAALGALALFPLSELAIQIVNALVISLLPPDLLPKMDFEAGIPPEQATLVAVPMMLSSDEIVRQEVEKLEVRFLANPEPNLFFSLLSDFNDAAERVTPEDAELLQAAIDGIADLNARHPGGRFLLFHRQREWSKSERSWIGPERKRGKIGALNAFLSGEGDPGILAVGSLPLPVRYVITLDADTQLPAGAARRMVETIAHPLNRVVLDPVTRTRRRGFTIIQPRVTISLPGAMATRFTRVFADTTGTDPYCQAVSDAHQDLFGEAIFHGKAIYDVQAFRESVGNRFPAETLLSHDLIEGAHAGVGLATDIELFENMPLDYASYSRRQHRWIRGDWQIAPWILGRVPSAQGGWQPNPLSLISRWRILDNLRRSLVPIASWLLLLFGWLISTAPGVWSLVVGLGLAIPALAPLLDRLARRLQGSVHGWQGAFDDLVRVIVMVALLPHQAWLSMDAILRILYRRWVSGHHLLEWQTAETTGLHRRRHLTSTMRQTLVISGLSVLLLVVVNAAGALARSQLFIALWILSPALMRWFAQPAPDPSRPRFDVEHTLFLRGVARRTWRYFDDLVGPENNWLPPDNTQLALRVEVAQRTSPTNIGLWLTSVLAARDFGYLTVDDYWRRCSRTMETLDRMERYEGHLLNWYGTQTLEPLAPRYVSTVDSGNLLAGLWVLEQGCHDAVRCPLIGQACLRGLSDTLSILRVVCGLDPSVAVPLRELRRLLRGKAAGHELIGRLRLALTPVQHLQNTWRWQAPGDERVYWVARMAAELQSWTDIVDRYLVWMETLTHPPDSFLGALGDDTVSLRRSALHSAPSILTLASEGVGAMEDMIARRGVMGLKPEVSAWLDQLDSEYRRGRASAAEAVNNLQLLATNAGRFAAGVNMRFLYDSGRRLFGVGYAVGGPVEFHSHYDLLASECRLASLVAIAKGDVPVEHWFVMGRPWVASGGERTLLSWSGTMFEYLMPLLFTRIFAHSLLDHACRNAVQRQIEHGREQNLPWGVSESAYSALDVNQIYQYRAFGVPKLALKTGLEGDAVVAPYATMLALPVDPESSIQNLRRLEGLGLNGPMGFYEAIDFSRETSRDGERGVVIYAYMAHHQGMTLTALDNVLHRGAMQRRFHRHLRVRAVESLLFERIPITRVAPDEVQPAPSPVRGVATDESAERVWKEDTSIPRVHLYGNGSYALMLSNSGAGYSRWKEFDLSRWRSDTTLDQWGSRIYLRDLRSDSLWTAAYLPPGGQLGTCTVHFSADRAAFRRRVEGVESLMEVTVAPEDDVELRRLTVTNRTLRSRQIEVTSYVELALAPHAADKAHPAFAKLFTETDCIAEGVLIARRRPRSPDDAPVWAAHIVIGASGPIHYETDRASFLGRGNTTASPEALRRKLNGASGTVLDPIFSLRCRATLEPRDQLDLCFVTLAADSRDALIALVEKYKNPEAVSRSFEMMWTRTQLDFRYLGIGPAAAHRFQELASHLIYPNPRFRASSDRIVKNRLGQSGLWAYGISGDLPMLTVLASDSFSLPLVREVLLAHTYWRMRGFRADLIILNQEIPSYDRPFREQIQRQVDAHSSQTGVDRPGGVFVRDWHSIPEEHRDLILSASSVVLGGNRGSLQQQLTPAGEIPVPPRFVPASGAQEEPSEPLPFLELPYFNGIGGFTPDAREYCIYLKRGDATPAPWANVMAHPEFGAVVTESGLGFTWNGNSQSNRLTPWHNDPVSDPQSEVIYLRDDESGACWTPTPQPIREKDAYRARHGQGYTVFEHNSHAIGQELTVFVPVTEAGTGDPVKVCRLRLRNDSSRTRRLTVTYFAEWVLGSNRDDQQLHIHTARDGESGALLARQSWRGSYMGYVAFAASSPRAASYSGDRTQFLGRNRSVSRPAALDRARLDNRTGTGLDPAAALQIQISIERDGQSEIIFLLGQTETVEEVRALVSRYGTGPQVERSLASTRTWWDSILGGLQVRTPLLSADFLLNRWLLYQDLSCRFWARSALYQSGGAFGFRDQLQDSLALLYTAPELTRAHILTAAARQFVEGDVQHWWHSDTGMGVRTRCADDLLWLPYAVEHYVGTSGDESILDEEVLFLEGPQLGEGEQDRLFTPAISRETASVWEHCRRALDRALQFGPHGLPLFGAGDWNDGMNRVGIEGRGESVWLAWFLCRLLRSFASLAEARETGTASNWFARATTLAENIERSCWDGQWYLRGFFDSGAPLGSQANEEAQIDSLPQSWAVISGAGDPDRSRQAVESADRLLVNEADRLVLLFTPPFDHSQPHPGYIMGYPPGVRENGGQYTHGSLWLAMAWARLGNAEAAVRLLTLMNPVEHSRDPERVARYRGEPYAVAADVSGAAGNRGRSGWTWYTGSAGWMYRIWIEEVLGFRLRGDTLRLAPVIPEEWPGFDATYRYRSSTYQISVRRGDSVHETVVSLDGEIMELEVVQLVNDGGLHRVQVLIPHRNTGQATADRRSEPSWAGSSG